MTCDEHLCDVFLVTPQIVDFRISRQVDHLFSTDVLNRLDQSFSNCEARLSRGGVGVLKEGAQRDRREAKATYMQVSFGSFAH